MGSGDAAAAASRLLLSLLLLLLLRPPWPPRLGGKRRGPAGRCRGCSCRGGQAERWRAPGRRLESSGPPGRGPESAEPGAAAPTRDSGRGRGRPRHLRWWREAGASTAPRRGGPAHGCAKQPLPTRGSAPSRGEQFAERGYKLSLKKKKEKKSTLSTSRAVECAAGFTSPPSILAQWLCSPRACAVGAASAPAAAVWTPPRVSRPPPPLPRSSGRRPPRAATGGAAARACCAPGLQEPRGCSRCPRAVGCSHLFIYFSFFFLLIITTSG